MVKTRKETKLIRFVKRALSIISKARVPLRSSKFSNRIYSNHIHLVLHILRVSTRMSYERFFEWIENFTGLWPVLGISRIPHFTTLQKFTQRCPKRYLDQIILVSGLNDDRPMTTSLDSTGFSITNASYYYTVTIKHRQESRGKPGLGRSRKRRMIKKYLKVTILVDTASQKILAVCVRRGPDNDNKDFVRLFNGIEENRKVNIGMVLADKGYDSEANHEYVHEILGADSIIPARRYQHDDYKTRGKYRKKMKAGYDLDTYRRRNISETVNSVLKRKMGDCVKAKNVLNQNREILFISLAYNLEKDIISLFILRGILESPQFRV